MDFFGGVLGDRGETRVDVLDHAVAIDQQKRVGALLDCTLEQVQGAGGSAAIVVVDDLRELVSQLTGKGDFIGLPGAGDAGLFQAQHADHLPIDANTGVEHGVDVARAQGFGHLPGTRVAHRVVRIDGATAMQGVHVIREATDVDHVRKDVFLGRAVVRGDRHQMLAFEVPQAGAVDFIDIAGAAGD
ncbi:hypothetical protein D3C81_1394190 [compost metagenome]